MIVRLRTRIETMRSLINSERGQAFILGMAAGMVTGALGFILTEVRWPI